MKKFTKQINKVKNVLLSYSNRTIKSKSADSWELWYCTPDLTEFGKRINLLRRFVALYDLTRSEMEYNCKVFNHLEIKTAERYPVYVAIITLRKDSNGTRTA